LVKGAGIVVLKKENDDYRVLCLYEENKKGVRKYDMTKGAIDKGEEPFQTATRETREEAGIKKVKFKWGRAFLNKNGIVMYIATTKDTPKITPNPTSGIIEHDGYEWNSFESAYILMPDYLKPFVTWAESIVKGEKDVKI
jgi:8-oxo-dGTP pyrophosphatase MutT (NUDIX family)